MRTVAILLLILASTGCVSTQAFIPPNQVVDFKQYEKVQVDIVDEVHTSYSKYGILLFRGNLEARLKSMDYSIVEENPDLVLQIKVTNFKPGNKALRMFIGWGAGRALLTYLATFETPSGTLIAKLTGGKSYHGFEIFDDQTFSSKGRIQLNMVDKAVSQLGHFILTNGEAE